MVKALQDYDAWNHENWILNNLEINHKVRISRETFTNESKADTLNRDLVLHIKPRSSSTHLDNALKMCWLPHFQLSCAFYSP